jgi:hypothetical protein
LLPVIEFRQYTLRPGQRDALVDLFDSELVEPQEAEGMPILGQFRDLDDPDRFVWLRGFPSLETRAPSLQAFYGGPTWREHGPKANATMIDSDDVLLLRPISGALTTASKPGVWLFQVYLGEKPFDPTFTVPGAQATFVTEYSKNMFPALPVREGEHAYVWCARYASQHEVPEQLDKREPPGTIGRQRLILAPTSGSKLR